MQTIKMKSDYQRLNELAGNRYAQIYSQIKKVTVIGSDLEQRIKREWYNDKTKTWDNDYHLVLTVTNETGKFSFPIENCSKAGVANYDEEIQNIFFNVLSMATTSKQIA